MSESLTDFGKLLSLVSITFLLGVGLGLSMADSGHHLGLTFVVATGGIVCITMAALIEKIVFEGRPR